MRRIEAYHDWNSRWWTERAGTWARADGQRMTDESTYSEGASAYAHRQAALRAALRDHCKKTWKHVPEWIDGCRRSKLPHV